jgi:hypothetical protein
MCTCPLKLQHNSWNFISIKNVHETFCILLSNLRFWRLDHCCKDRRQGGNSSGQALVSTMLVSTSRSYDISYPRRATSFALILIVILTSPKLHQLSPLYPKSTLAFLSFIVIFLGRISSGSLHSSFPVEIDTLEYSWVKATMVSVRSQIYLWSYSIQIGFLVLLRI